MTLIESIIERAKSNKQRIVLPESLEERTLTAADKALADEIAEIILIGNREEIFALAEKLGLKNIDKATIIDPATSEKTAEYANLLYELRKNKGMTPEKAAQLVLDPLYFGCLIIKSGDADGQISGALSTTGETLRPALQIIKCSPGISCVSGAMLMITNTPEYGEDGVLVVGDVAVTPMPDASQLAQIAVCTAQTAKAVAGFEDPRVAMLSFSTKGSAKHEAVDKVTEALKVAQELAPELKVDGELQLDAAIVPEIGESKAPGSSVAGHANVLVFPDLGAGNIGYKLRTCLVLLFKFPRHRIERAYHFVIFINFGVCIDGSISSKRNFLCSNSDFFILCALPPDRQCRDARSDRHGHCRDPD